MEGHIYSIHLSILSTHIMHPDDFVCLGMSPYVTVEVDIVPLGNVGRDNVAPEAQLDFWGV